MKLRFSVLLAVPLLLLLSTAGASGLNEGFLREEPYRKQKQHVDLSSVTSAQELAVVGTAINPIMRFLVGLSFADIPKVVSTELSTAYGRQVLRLPPLRKDAKKNRYSVVNVKNWHVCGATSVSFDATFSDLLRRDFWDEKFLFVNEGSGWRFEAHREAEC